jgi:putative ABC transport system permease protein
VLPPRARRLLRLAVRGDRRLREERRATEVDDEIRLHLELRVQQLVASGMPPDEARRRALAKFGPLAEARPRLRDAVRRREDRVHLRERLDALSHDFRAALRAVRATPGFTLVVVLTLALGIGANAAIFSVVDAVLLRPLPYARPEGLVVLGGGPSPREMFPASYPQLLDWRERTRGAFAAVGAYFTTQYTLTGRGEPEVIEGARVSADLPAMLGATVLVGRSFRADEEPRSGERVALLSEALWRRRFGADPGVLGQVLTLNGYQFTVIGVLRGGPGSTLPTGLATGRRTDLWTPLRLDAVGAPRGLNFLTVLARLKPGTDLARARAGARAASAALRGERVDDAEIQVQSLTERVAGDVRARLFLLLGAVGLVLLIACANVANLLLARAAAREREIAVRVALGAGRGRVVSQWMAESLLRALLGGAAGVGVAYAALAAVRRWLPARLPRFEEVGVDARVLVFALALSMATGLLFGIVPALRAAAQNPATLMREGGRGLAGGLRRDRVRAGLVVSEVALSFVMLVGAGLLIQSFARLARQERGFDEAHTLVAQVSLPSTRYPDTVRVAAFYRQLLERLAARPGVRGAATASNVPVEGGTNGGFEVEGLSFPKNDRPIAEKRVVSAGYFPLLRARLVAGRDFDARDVAGAPRVMIVNETFARRWLGGPQAAVGKRVGFLWEMEGMQTVVGVVANVREGPPDQPAVPAMYVAAAQLPFSSVNVLLRTDGDPLDAVAMLRREVLALDRDLPISQVRTLADIVAEGTARQRLSAALVGAFSALALLLAAVGLYGVVSYSVVQRTREFGIRSALGAQPADVVRLVLAQGAALVLIGLAAGLAMALALGRVLASQLFGIAPNDAATLAGVAALLAAVALAATAAPAVRATRLDPLLALRQE